MTLLQELLALTRSKVRLKKKAELAAACGELGLDESGKKTQVFDRLWKHLENKRNEPEQEEKYLSDNEEPQEEPAEDPTQIADPTETRIETSGSGKAEAVQEHEKQVEDDAPDLSSTDRADSAPKTTKEPVDSAHVEEAPEEPPAEVEAEKEKIREDPPAVPVESAEEQLAAPAESVPPVETTEMEVVEDPPSISEEPAEQMRTEEPTEQMRTEEPAMEPPETPAEPEAQEEVTGTREALTEPETQEEAPVQPEMQPVLAAEPETDDEEPAEEEIQAEKAELIQTEEPAKAVMQAKEPTATPSSKAKGEQNDLSSGATRCLWVSGFKRPVNHGKVESLFSEYGRVNQFWMDDYKNNALIEYAEVSSSEKAFTSMNDTHWPRDLPEAHASFLKIKYEDVDGFEGIKTKILDNPENMDPPNPMARIAPIQTDRTNVTRKERIDSVAGEIKSPRELTTRKRKREDEEVKTVEDKMRHNEQKVAQLFRCTEESKPKLFWKPLTKDEYIERQQRKRQRRTYEERREREQNSRRDRRDRDRRNNNRHRDHHDRRGGSRRDYERRGSRRDYERRRGYERRGSRRDYDRRDRSRSRNHSRRY